VIDSQGFASQCRRERVLPDDRQALGAGGAQCWISWRVELELPLAQVEACWLGTKGFETKPDLGAISAEIQAAGRAAVVGRLRIDAPERGGITVQVGQPRIRCCECQGAISKRPQRRD
jgi:hypothetical protein